MKILAIDQSITETGYWLDDNINGSIKSNIKGVTERISNIKSHIKNMVVNNNVDTVVMEGYSFGSRHTRFTFTAGELGGAIKLYCLDNNIKLIIIPPTMLKKFICGKGNVKKEQILLQLYKKYGKEFSNNNIADAYGLFKFYEAYNKWLLNNEGFTKNEKECFKTLDGLIKDGG